MENSLLAKSMRTLTAITSELQRRQALNELMIPDIVVVGSKYVGKSSTIEKLIGFECLPKSYVPCSRFIE